MLNIRVPQIKPFIKDSRFKPIENRVNHDKALLGVKTIFQKQQVEKSFFKQSFTNLAKSILNLQFNAFHSKNPTLIEMDFNLEDLIPKSQLKTFKNSLAAIKNLSPFNKLIEKLTGPRQSDVLYNMGSLVHYELLKYFYPIADRMIDQFNIEHHTEIPTDKLIKVIFCEFNSKGQHFLDINYGGRTYFGVIPIKFLNKKGTFQIRFEMVNPYYFIGHKPLHEDPIDDLLKREAIYHGDKKLLPHHCEVDKAILNQPRLRLSDQ